MSRSSILARRCRRGLSLLPLALLLVAALATSAQAASVDLGTAAPFSVLGATTVTNTGPSVINGDLGLYPGTAVTGFPPGTVNGTVHANDTVAQNAQSALITAYDDAAGRSSTATVSADLAGSTLTPGVYTSGSTLGLNGDLTLDGQGDPNAVFIFQAGSSLTTGSSSRVLLTGMAQACNVFWQVGSDATVGTSTAFAGNILAMNAISLTTGATLNGRALARNAAVTLDTNTVTRADCATTSGPSAGTTPGGTTRAPSAKAPARRSPAVTTRRPTRSRICLDHARLGGTVRPAAGAIRYHFQFGTTKRYGRRTASHRVSKGAKALPVYTEARGLRPGTTYHYRIVGIGPGGRKTYGADRTFRTLTHECRSDRSPARPPRTPRGFTG